MSPTVLPWRVATDACPRQRDVLAWDGTDWFPFYTFTGTEEENQWPARYKAHHITHYLLLSPPGASNPPAAQHQETVRLLEELVGSCKQWNSSGYDTYGNSRTWIVHSYDEAKLEAARAHLDTLKQSSLPHEP